MNIKKIIEFSVKNSFFINLLSVFLIIAGIISLVALRREAFPNVNYDMVVVNTEYFGATPDEVEKLVTIELEDELNEVSGIDEMTSISSENMSLIIIKIDPSETDKAKIINDIQRAVDRADDLPEDVEDPKVNEIQTKDMPVINVSVSGDMSEYELQKYARELEVELLDLGDVAGIDRMGWRDREIWIEVDPERVKDDLLSLKDIVLALKNQNLNLPGGNLTTPEGDYLIRTMGEFETAKEIENVIIRANDRGNWIRISDIGKVIDTFEDDDLIERAFGKRAITLTVLKKEKGDIIELVKEVKKTANAFQKKISKNLKITYFDDYSFYVKRRLNVLKNNGSFGIVFVVFALLIFLSRSTALITALGIPLAFFITFFLMGTLGYTINLITMFALIMVLGLVVDDAIVVSENVYRYIEEGMPPHEAAIHGANQVALPVIVTVLTTIVAFVPLFFMGGILGKYIRAIPVVVIIALSASLFECFVILPSHLADWVKKRKKSEKKEQAWFKKLQEKYLKVLKWVIGHRYKALLIFAACFIGAIMLFFSSMKFILFPQGLIEEFFIKVKAPIGTSLKDTGRRMEKIEEFISNLPKSELENFITQVGLIKESPDDPFEDKGSNIGQIHVFLTPEKTRDRRHADEIIDSLRKEIKSLDDSFEEVRFDKVKSGPPVGKPINVRIRGDDLSVLEEVAEKIKKMLKELPGTKDVRDDFEVGKTELRIEVDEEKATKAYLTVRDIATSVKNAIDGGVATTIRKTDEEIDVIVRYPEERRSTQEIFESIYVPNKFDNLVPLTKIASLTKKEGLDSINHFDRKRMINITSDLDEKKNSPLKLEKVIEEFYSENIEANYPGVVLSFGGEQEETKESLEDFFRALQLAVFLIFIILAAKFNSIVRPLIVMMAIPFGIVGVILAFFFHGQPLSFMALLGIIGLSGVVVNDSIVLVDFIQNLRIKGMGRFDSIMEAGKLRLRPVLLTTITTIVGLMPVAYGIGGSDPFLKPMALTISWGLAFATVLTLLLIPCLYAISDDFSKRLSDWRKHYLKSQKTEFPLR